LSPALTHTPRHGPRCGDSGSVPTRTGARTDRAKPRRREPRISSAASEASLVSKRVGPAR
jgi:hypothetical protein